MTSSFIHHDSRTGDIFIVHLADEVFSIAFCHVDRIGSDPIVYDELEDLPNGVRQDVEQKIHERLQ